MSAITIDISSETYKKLAEQARHTGKKIEVLSSELLEDALTSREAARPKTVREVLQAKGQVRPLGDTLRRRIIPGVTLDQVRKALTQAGGPSLSEIILAQRGPKV
ncbi:MAG: hypothetical protein GY801_04235 [bacterium]|nr:hypothetical protein [bacterium]